jgi:hypothetical protein
MHLLKIQAEVSEYKIRNHTVERKGYVAEIRNLKARLSVQIKNCSTQRYSMKIADSVQMPVTCDTARTYIEEFVEEALVCELARKVNLYVLAHHSANLDPNRIKCSSPRHSSQPSMSAQ